MDARRNVILAAACVAVLALACRGESRGERVETIAAAVPAPAPPSPQTQTIGRRPDVTTSGSPTPSGEVHVQFEPVVLRPGSISVRGVLPAGATVFRVTNEDQVPRRLVIAGASSRTTLGAPLAPGSSAILQFVLSDRRYTFEDADPDRSAPAVVTTYRPR